VATTDAQLVAQTLRGDKRAFSELVRRHQGRTLAAAIHLTGDREAAEDLAQEAFVEAYRGLANLRDRARFAGWLFGILRLRCRRFLARRGPTTVSLEAGNVPEPVASDPPREADASDLMETLARLPQESRELLAARYLSDLSYAQIAEMLGITVGNVRVKCYRAREALRALMETAGEPALPEGGGA
jgi:RNA polymerase sigma-70 factor (ECF subfamily)